MECPLFTVSLPLRSSVPRFRYPHHCGNNKVLIHRAYSIRHQLALILLYIIERENVKFS